MHLALPTSGTGDLAETYVGFSTVYWLPLLDSNQPHSRLTAEHHHLDSLEGMIIWCTGRELNPRHAG